MKRLSIPVLALGLAATMMAAPQTTSKNPRQPTVVNTKASATKDGDATKVKKETDTKTKRKAKTKSKTENQK